MTPLDLFMYVLAVAVGVAVVPFVVLGVVLLMAGIVAVACRILDWASPAPKLVKFQHKGSPLVTGTGGDDD